MSDEERTGIDIHVSGGLLARVKPYVAVIGIWLFGNLTGGTGAEFIDLFNARHWVEENEEKLVEADAKDELIASLEAQVRVYSSLMDRCIIAIPEPETESENAP